jgi:hypothetical protein
MNEERCRVHWIRLGTWEGRIGRMTEQTIGMIDACAFGIDCKPIDWRRQS